MRKLILILVLSATLPVTADVIDLRNSGRLDGTVESVTFFANDANTDYARADFRNIVLGEKTDQLVLNNGRTVSGTASSFKFRTIGGSISLQRQEILSLQLTTDPQAEARAELAKKRANVAGDDDAALYELALWCREQGLNREARELAQASLDANPTGAHTNDAHRLLGHVYYSGEWMTLAEMLQRDPNAKPEEPPTAGQSAAKHDSGPTETGTSDNPEAKTDTPAQPMTEEEIARAKASNDRLLQESKDRLGQATNAVAAEIKAKYDEMVKSATEDMKQLAKDLRAKSEALDANKKQSRVIVMGGVKYWHPNKGIWDNQKQALEDDIKRLTQKAIECKETKSSAPSKMSSEINKANNRSLNCIQKLQNVYDKNADTIQSKIMITDEQLAESYEQILTAYNVPSKSPEADSTEPAKTAAKK